MKNPSFLFFILLLLLGACHHQDKQDRTPHKKPLPAATHQKLNAGDSLLLVLDELKKDSSLRNASFGYYITDYSSGRGKLITAYNENLSLVPASTMKVFTTAAALEILGGNHSFKTALLYDGKIENHVLKGNIYIRGGGDPTFGSPALFQRWAGAFNELGIDTVEGAVIGDGRLFGRFTIPGTWTWGELLLPYCAPANGLTVYGNVFSGNGNNNTKGKYVPPPGELQPDLPEVLFENAFAEIDDPTAETYIQGDPYGYGFSIQGSIRKGQTTFPYAGVIPDPAFIAASELRNALVSKGIFVKGPAIDIVKADSALTATISKKPKEVSFSYSPTVSALVNLTNQHSINLYAEHLMKQVALAKLHNGSPEGGCKAVLDFWKEKGIDTRGLFIYDGCGISRYNGVTAKQLSDVLLYMSGSPNFQVFYNSLPLAGETGTLAKMFHGTKAEGNLRAKTGTMSRVKSYSGYVRTTSGKRLIFTFIINNFTCTQEAVKGKLEKAMVSITAL